MQALARLVAAGEDDAVLAVGRIGARRDEHAVRDDLVLAREPALGGLARALGDGDAVVEPVGEEAPDRLRELHPAEVAARVEGRDHRRRAERERRDARRRRHRLVQVDDVEALALERVRGRGRPSAG